MTHLVFMTIWVLMYNIIRTALVNSMLKTDVKVPCAHSMVVFHNTVQPPIVGLPRKYV